MGIFSRARDILAANVNAILDRAEDPEKLVRYMIQEMEETLVEIKSACAQAMAAERKVRRELDAVAEREAAWESRARLAVDKGRDDLAREALVERREAARRRQVLETDLAVAADHVAAYKEDIGKLEDKLAGARDRQRQLVARHHRAAHGRKVVQDMQRYDAAEALRRFECFEARVDRLEADAELEREAACRPAGRPGQTDPAQDFARLERDAEIEADLQRLKTGGNGETPKE